MKTLTSTNKASIKTVTKPGKTVKARITIKPSMISDRVWILSNKEIGESVVVSYSPLIDADLVNYALRLKSSKDSSLTYMGNKILNCIRLN